MLIACRGKPTDSPGGKCCSCGWPSRRADGWCGRPNVLDTIMRVVIIMDELGFNDDPDTLGKPHMKCLVLKKTMYEELLLEMGVDPKYCPKFFMLGATRIALGK